MSASVVPLSNPVLNGKVTFTYSLQATVDIFQWPNVQEAIAALEVAIQPPAPTAAAEKSNG